MIICEMNITPHRAGKNGYFCSILSRFSHPHIWTTLRLAVFPSKKDINITFRSKKQ